MVVFSVLHCLQPFKIRDGDYRCNWLPAPIEDYPFMSIYDSIDRIRAVRAQISRADLGIGVESWGF